MSAYHRDEDVDALLTSTQFNIVPSCAKSLLDVILEEQVPVNRCCRLLGAQLDAARLQCLRSHGSPRDDRPRVITAFTHLPTQLDPEVGGDRVMVERCW